VIRPVLRNDPDFLYRIADRVVGRIKRPPTLTREDMRQDAVVATIELLDAGWVAPPRFPAELALILAVRRCLGGRRDAYYAEWQWATRRAPIPTLDGTDYTETALVAPAAPVVADTVDSLIEELLSYVPPKLRRTAEALFRGLAVRRMNTATVGISQKQARRQVSQIVAALTAHGLWHDNLYTSSLGERWDRADTTRSAE